MSIPMYIKVDPEKGFELIAKGIGKPISLGAEFCVESLESSFDNLIEQCPEIDFEIKESELEKIREHLRANWDSVLSFHDFDCSIDDYAYDELMELKKRKE